MARRKRRKFTDEFKADAVITHPDCPFCKTPMVLRTSKAGGSFWGCPGFPQCTGTRDARMELLGDVLAKSS